MMEMKRLLENPNSGFILITILIISALFVETLYLMHLKDVELNSGRHGMNEYELCQMAYDAFGMEMVEKIGCRVSIQRALE